MATNQQTNETMSKSIPLPFSYGDLDGKFTALPLYHYQQLCLALEIIEKRLACDEPGSIDLSIDPDLGEVHTALMIAVACHPHWKNESSICNEVQTAVRAKFLTYRQESAACIAS